MDDRLPLLGEYLEGWLEVQRTRLQPSTWESYRGNVQRYLAPAFGDVALDGLTAVRLDGFYARLLTAGGLHGKPLSLRTVRFCHAVLHKALADAVRLDLLVANPTDRATLPRYDPRTGSTGRSEVRAWSAEEVRSFLAHVEDHPRRDLWLVAIGTGLRRGELLGLRRRDVDLGARVLSVRRALSVVGGIARLKAPKTSRTRTLRLDAPTTVALGRAMTGPCDPAWELVFGDEAGAPLDPMAITHEFRAMVRTAPVPPLRLHDLRHTHATLMLAAGVPVKVVSERLGHATIALTLDVYAHVLPAMDGDAVERFAALVHPGS